MKLYRIHDADQRGYPYAYDYGPLPYDVPFVFGERLKLKIEVWRLNPTLPGLEIAESGSKWGDFMMCGCGLPSVVYSERVLHAMKTTRCSISSETEFPVGKIRSKKLRNVPPPRYFACQWRPGIEVDWTATGVKLNDKGQPIFGLNIPPRIARLSTWNGDDIFSWVNFESTHLTMLCTERVVELAKKQKWTNVRFELVQTS